MSAAQRISKSAVDWVKFAKRVPAAEQPKFIEFKSKHDKQLASVNKFPDSPPKINWSSFETSTGNAALVADFKKQYEALSVPYPADTTTAVVEQQQAESKKEIEEKEKILNSNQKDRNDKLAKWQQLKPFEQMTTQEFLEAFPQLANNYRDRPIDRMNVIHRYGWTFQHWIRSKMIHDAGVLQEQLANQKKLMTEIEKDLKS